MNDDQNAPKEKNAEKQPTPVEAQRRIETLVNDIKVAMLSSRTPDGALKSRPMHSQEIDSTGSIWFFTGKSTEVAQDIEYEDQVNLGFANPEKSEYVSICGRAELVEDDAKKKELWKPIMKAWFPKGLEDPDLILLKIVPFEGEYWDAPTGKMIQFLKIAGAAITGTGYTSSKGEHANVRM